MVVFYDPLFIKVEEVMKNTLRVTLEASLAKIEGTERTKWVLDWPGQLVIAGCQTYWSAHVETGITTRTLPQYYQEMLDQVCIHAPDRQVSCAETLNPSGDQL